jgi:hypothetical protein
LDRCDRKILVQSRLIYGSLSKQIKDRYVVLLLSACFPP